MKWFVCDDALDKVNSSHQRDKHTNYVYNALRFYLVLLNISI